MFLYSIMMQLYKVHHSFQGCPASGGWSHSSSTDLVHWKDEGRGVHILQENYEGTSAPLFKGFVGFFKNILLTCTQYDHYGSLLITTDHD